MSHHHHCHGDHHEACCSEEHDCCSEHHHHECCDHHHHEHHSFAQDLLDLADEAWMELLKDKIKEQILKKNGAQLDKLAKLVSDSNNSRWSHKLGSQSASEDYHQKISDFFHTKG